MKKLTFIFLALLIASCSKESTPELALREFVDYRFEPGQSREKLLDLSTGELHERIESMTDKELEELVNVKDLKKRNLKVLIKNCDEQICYLTYVLRYVKGEEAPKDFSIEVKKIAQVNKVEEKWLLSDVSNVKTYIESKKELSISEEGETEK